MSEQKKKNPTSTPTQARSGMYFYGKTTPVHFKGLPNYVVENDAYKITIIGSLLNQTHRSILDIIFSEFQSVDQGANGVGFIFTKYEILKQLGHANPSSNTSWLSQKFEDMRKTSIICEYKKDGFTHKIYEGIVTKHQVIKSSDTNNREIKYGVLFSPSFMQLFDKETNIYSEKLTSTIIKFTNAPSQALIRYCLASKYVNKPLDDVLAEIGMLVKDNKNLSQDSPSAISIQAYNSHKRKIMADKNELLEAFGIRIDDLANGSGKCIRYEKHKDVYFRNPELIII